MQLYQPVIFIASETETLPNDDIYIFDYGTVLRQDSKRYRDQNGLAVYAKKDSDVSVLYTYEN